MRFCICDYILKPRVLISLLNQSPEGNPVCLPFLIILYHKPSKSWSLPKRQRLLVLIFALYVIIGRFFAVFMWAFFRRMQLFLKPFHQRTKTARSACSCKPRCMRLHMSCRSFSAQPGSVRKPKFQTRSSRSSFSLRARNRGTYSMRMLEVSSPNH